MKKLFDDLKARLLGFIEQRDQAFLVVTCPDAQVAYCLKTLEGIEQADSPHTYWMLAHEFQDAHSYVEQCVQVVAARVQQLTQAIQESGEPMPMPAPLPAELRHPSEPVGRLQRLMGYTRELADVPPHNVIWGLFPLRIHDASAYVHFAQALLHHDWPVPWCRNLRIFVRDDSARALISRHLPNAARTDYYAFDFDPETLEQALVDQAADEAELPEMRMQAYLMLACIDYGHGRLPQAMEKYSTLATYYTNTGNPTLLALTLNGMGEVFLRSGDPTSAQRYFESALNPAIRAQESGLAVLINISLNLGNLKLQQQRFAEAIEYYESVGTLAQATNNAQLKLHVLESQGSCHLALGQTREAHGRFQQGVDLSRGLADEVFQERLLQRLLSLYESVGMADEAERTRVELKILAERGPEALQPLAGVRQAGA